MKFLQIIAIWVVRLLSWQRGLEGFMCIVGITWATGMLVSHDYIASSFAEPAKFELSSKILAALLLISCFIGYIGMIRNVRFLRSQTSVVAFICWGLRAVFTTKLQIHPWHVFAIYVCFACAELSIYIRIITGLDMRENQIVRRVDTGENHDRGD